MAKNLIIVESPTKAKTITKYLCRGYTVMASVGHVKDLPTSKLGVDLENDFEPQYVTIKVKSKVLSEIKKKAEEADKVFLAPDPDREAPVTRSLHSLQSPGHLPKRLSPYTPPGPAFQ